MKEIRAVIVILLATGLLAGCSGRGGISASEPDKSGIYVTDAGTFSTTTVEPYEDHDYYEEGEWTAFLQRRIDKFNAEHGEGAVTLRSNSQKDGTIRMEFSYATGDALVQFAKEYHDTVNEVDSIRMMSVKEALSQAEAEAVSFVRAKDGRGVTPDEIGKHDDYRVVVVEGPPVKLKMEGSVAYASGNVSMNGSKAVDTAQGKNYIIFK